MKINPRDSRRIGWQMGLYRFLPGFIFLFFALASCRQKPKTTGDRFLEFLNSYRVDSLNSLLAGNFQLKRTYTNSSHNKTSFLEAYVPGSKAFNGKFHVLKSSERTEPLRYLVEDRSDYLTYLRIPPAVWQISIYTDKQGKVETVIIDTTDSYQSYLAQVKEKGEAFEQWLKATHPDDTREMLYGTEGLLAKRLKEYSAE